MTAQPLPYRVSYGKSPGRNIGHTSESAARHEAAKLAMRGHTATYWQLNPRTGKYVSKEIYEAAKVTS